MRFWAKVDKQGPNGCWMWTGAKAKEDKQHQPYGRFQLATRTPVAAHRYAYELLIGPIPEGLHLDHLCRNPPCVNPAHLEPVTAYENTRRGLAWVKVKELHTHCKRGHPLTEDNIRYISGKRKGCKTCVKAYMAEYGRNRRQALRDARSLELGSSQE